MYWRRSKMKNAATSAAITASTASLPLVMDGFLSTDPGSSPGDRTALRESRAVHHARVVRSVRRRRFGPAREESPHPAFVVVVDAQRVHVDAGALQAAHAV